MDNTFEVLIIKTFAVMDWSDSLAFIDVLLYATL